MSKITFIIPINDFSEENRTLFDNMILSLNKQAEEFEAILVSSAEIIETIKLYGKEKDIDLSKITNFLVNDDINSFTKQINFATKSVTTDYFSILEFDDEIHDNYVGIFNRYESKTSDISVYLPINIDLFYNEDNKKVMARLFNDSIWNKMITQENELGVYTTEILLEHTSFNLSGSVFRLIDFIEVGKFKTNFDLTFYYEFLLRITNSNKKVISIPKILYLHTINRINSYHDLLYKRLSQEDINSLYDYAKKEYFFNEERSF